VSNVSKQQSCTQQTLSNDISALFSFIIFIKL